MTKFQSGHILSRPRWDQLQKCDLELPFVLVFNRRPGGGGVWGVGGGGGIRLVLQQNDTSEAVAIRIIHRFIGEVILKRASHYPAKIDLVCHLGDQPAIT